MSKKDDADKMVIVEQIRFKTNLMSLSLDTLTKIKTLVDADPKKS